ncbi:hypothetical protein JXA85_02540 [Candidatus Woesearchaeota archaeon]|nr:hypothetical protein [Candidatus Woesearchaeota archaeon]
MAAKDKLEQMKKKGEMEKIRQAEIKKATKVETKKINKEEQMLRLEKKAKAENLDAKQIYKELLQIDPNATIIDAMKIKQGSLKTTEIKGRKRPEKNQIKAILKMEKIRAQKEAGLKVKTERAEKRAKRVDSSEAAGFMFKGMDAVTERAMLRNEKIKAAKEKRVLELQLEKLKLQEEKEKIAKEKGLIEEIKKKEGELKTLVANLETPEMKAKREKEDADIMLKYKADSIEEARQREAEEKRTKALQSKKEFYQKKSKMKKGETRILTGEIKVKTDYYKDTTGRDVKGEIYISPGGKKITELDKEFNQIHKSNELAFNLRKESLEAKMKRELVEDVNTGEIKTMIRIENPEQIKPSQLNSFVAEARGKGFEVREVTGKDKKKKLIIIG